MQSVFRRSTAVGQKEKYEGDDKMKRNKGFTLAELLIVVAIVAVLVAIAIPVFHSQLERSRKAVDLHTARSVESILAAAVNDGSVELVNPKNNNEPKGIWVVLCRDSSSWPVGYNGYKTVFYGADPGVVINGAPSVSKDLVNNADVQKILEEAGMNAETLKIKSKDKKDGWDWIVIQVGYLHNEVFTRIYSGFKGAPSGANKVPVGSTNIEKMIEQK